MEHLSSISSLPSDIISIISDFATRWCGQNRQMYKREKEALTSDCENNIFVVATNDNLSYDDAIVEVFNLGQLCAFFRVDDFRTLFIDNGFILVFHGETFGFSIYNFSGHCLWRINLDLQGYGLQDIYIKRARVFWTTGTSFVDKIVLQVFRLGQYHYQTYSCQSGLLLHSFNVKPRIELGFLINQRCCFDSNMNIYVCQHDQHTPNVITTYDCQGTEVSAVIFGQPNFYSPVLGLFISDNGVPNVCCGLSNWDDRFVQQIYSLHGNLLWQVPTNNWSPKITACGNLICNPTAFMTEIICYY